MGFRKQFVEKLSNRFRTVKTFTKNYHKISIIKVEDLFNGFTDKKNSDKSINTALTRISKNPLDVLIGLREEDKKNYFVKDRLSFLQVFNKSVLTISDLHLAKFYNSKVWEKIIQIIEENEVEVLVINGDYFDGSYAPEHMLNNNQFRDIIDKIRKYTAVVILPGNHDNNQIYLSKRSRFELYKPFYQSTHLKVLSNYFTKYLILELENDIGKKIMVWFEHGHRNTYDKFGVAPSELTKLNTVAYEIEKRLHLRFGDRFMKYVPGVLKINNKNIEWAVRNLRDCVISIGHSHYSDIKEIGGDLIFINSGSLKPDNNYGNMVLFKASGEVNLLEFEYKTGEEKKIRTVSL